MQSAAMQSGPQSGPQRPVRPPRLLLPTNRLRLRRRRRRLRLLLLLVVGSYDFAVVTLVRFC